MFPLPISTWIMIGLAALAMAGFGYGKYEHNALIEYKAEVLSVAKVQEAKNESIQKQSDLVNKGIQNAYEAKLAAVRNYYGGLHNTSGGKLPTLSNPSGSADESPAYYRLAESCSETTVQLTSLQDWINQQVGIK
jgi:hypothetical protein